MPQLLLVFIVYSAFAFPIPAQTPPWIPPPGRPTLNLWPATAPGSPANPLPETDITNAHDDIVGGRVLIRLTNVSKPTLTYYEAQPPNSGAAVVVFPGGAYHVLAIDLEGTEVCDWLITIHVNCILVKYRVPDSGPLPKSNAALQDAQRSLALVRQNAADWHIDPHKVGVLGFSAGAHLSVSLSTHFDRRLYNHVDSADQLPCRPDFAVIVYPGYLALAEQNFAPNPEIRVTPDTPPSFIVQTEDDSVHVENATLYFLELKSAKVPAELHIYAQGGHGYGLRRTNLPVTAWPALVETWLHTIKMLPNP